MSNNDRIYVSPLFIDDYNQDILYASLNDNGLNYNGKRFPTIPYKNADTSDLGKECSICQEKIKKQQKIYLLECNHLFHRHCLYEWYKYKEDCPLCRMNIKSFKR